MDQLVNSNMPQPAGLSVPVVADPSVEVNQELDALTQEINQIEKGLSGG